MPGAADAFEKLAVRLLCIDTIIPYLYTLPHVTEKLFPYIIAGVLRWLV